MKKLYNQVKRDQWRQDDYSMPVIARYGTGGGNVPIIVETLVFDESQITSKYNYSHPKWGGRCHPLTEEAGRAIVIIRTESDENIQPNQPERSIPRG